MVAEHCIPAALQDDNTVILSPDPTAEDVSALALLSLKEESGQEAYLFHYLTVALGGILEVL